MQSGDSENLNRFVRLHLGDGNENIGRKEIDNSWIGAFKVLLGYENPDSDFIEQVMHEMKMQVEVKQCQRGFVFFRKSSSFRSHGPKRTDNRSQAFPSPPNLLHQL